MHSPWQRIFQIGVTQDIADELAHRIRLVNQINLAMVMAGLLSATSNLLLGQYSLVPFALPVIALTTLPILLNHWRYYQLAQHVLTISLGVAILITAALLGEQSQLALALFPGFLLADMLFHHPRWRLLYFCYYALLVLMCVWLSYEGTIYLSIPYPRLVTFTLTILSMVGLFFALRFYREMERAQTNTIHNYQKSLEAIVSERTERLEQSLQELQRSNQDLEQFAYAASHDLQEPLRMIRNFSQLLEKKLQSHFDEDTRAYMGFIQDAVVRMSELIKGLLTYSRVGRSETPVVPCNIRAIVEEKLKDFQQLISEKSAKVSLGKLPEHLACESGQIGMLFANLIHNALKFNENPQPTLWIQASEEPDQWVFSIADNGIGIAPEYQEQVFEIFRTLHRREDFSGTGIGLALCRKIVERHGGQIWLSSTPGEGSCFYFSLPKKG